MIRAAFPHIMLERRCSATSSTAVLCNTAPPVFPVALSNPAVPEFADIQGPT